MPTTSATVYTHRLNYVGTPTNFFRDRRTSLTHAAKVMRGAGTGEVPAYALEFNINATTGQNALSTYALSSGADTVGVVVNGVTLSATYATSDAVSAGLIAAAVNASTNALVQYLVKASAVRATVTFVSAAAPVAVTLGGVVIVGQSYTPKPEQYGVFQVVGTDATDAAALAACINTHPSFNGRFLATSAAGVVSVFPLDGAVPSTTTIGVTGTGVTSAVFAASATALVWCLQKGRLGNTISFAATGTGVTAATARLTGGSGDAGTTYVDYV